MATNLYYQTDPSLAAQAAQQVGAAQYANQQQEVARQEAQFQQQMSLRQQLAQLEDMQQRRAMGARMGESAANRAAAAQSQQNQLGTQVYLAHLQQQGYTDKRDADQELLGQRLDAEKEMFGQRLEAETDQRLSQEQHRILEHHQNQWFNTGIESAKTLEKARPELSDVQYDQARQQWDQQFGQSVGKYPFMAPTTKQVPMCRRMRRKASKRGNRDPSPEVIAKRCAEIRAKWTEADYRRRAGWMFDGERAQFQVWSGDHSKFDDTLIVF